jgi:hypothetical protein
LAIIRAIRVKVPCIRVHPYYFPGKFCSAAKISGKRMEGKRMDLKIVLFVCLSFACHHSVAAVPRYVHPWLNSVFPVELK